MRSNRHPDILARALNSTGYFIGKTRLADSLGYLARSWHIARGIYPLSDGKTVAVDLRDRIQRLMWGGAYEPHVKKCLTSLLHPGDTFIDVGGHIGFFSLIASSLVGPSGKVYAFEANSDLFQKLQANASEHPWLVPSSRAVWNKSGPVSFSNPQQPGETGWGKLAAVRNDGNVVTITAVTLDDWHASVQFPAIRAIKIDAEGSEPFILEGASSLIAHSRPFLIIELNDTLLRAAGRSQEVVLTSLRDERYRIFAMSPASLDELDDRGVVSSPEILCIPSERFEEAKSSLKKFHIKTRQ
jgi:FkbM family methyltransferase